MKCECKKVHNFLDVYTSDKVGITIKQRWHKCFYCKKYNLSKWIRLHEARCDIRWKEYVAQ